MHSRILGEFRVEGGGHDSSLSNGNGVGAFGGDNLDGGSDTLNFWGADENHFQR